jgi:hypothetical protein
MGTSKAYSASIKGQPQWGALSGTVTSNCSNGKVSSDNLEKILSRYVGVIGGSGRAGRGKSNIAGKAGLRTARSLGAFLGAFGSSGNDIRAAFEQIGLRDLDGLTLDAVINRLLEHCSGPASTLDDVAAKSAAQKILEEIASDATTIDEWQAQLQVILDRETIEEVMERYFAYYIFEHLSIMFYEKLIVDKGKQECQNLFRPKD